MIGSDQQDPSRYIPMCCVQAVSMISSARCAALTQLAGAPDEHLRWITGSCTQPQDNIAALVAGNGVSHCSCRLNWYRTSFLGSRWLASRLTVWGATAAAQLDNPGNAAARLLTSQVAGANRSHQLLLQG